MYCEIPTFKRCFCCLPLRGGLLGYAYLKLAVTLLIYFMHPLITYHVNNIQFFVVLAVLATDIFVTTAFVVGGHNKNPRLLKVYMWYVIVTMTTALIVIMLQTFVFSMKLHKSILAPTALILVMILYLVFLIRSEILKLESERGNVRYQIGGDQTNINVDITPKQQNV